MREHESEQEAAPTTRTTELPWLPRGPAAVAPTSLTAPTGAIAGREFAPRRRLGQTGLRVSPIALSGNVFGWRTEELTTQAVLDAYWDAGGNFIDTADSYASGRSEVMIGRWMRDRRSRDDVVLATKVGKSAENPGLSAPALTASVDDSLRRLGTDRIDLLYLHLDDPLVEFDETLLAVDDLIRAGKVRFFGGSDHTAERLFLARVACAHLGVPPMVAVQNQYNLLFRREYERGLRPVAEQQGLAVMPRFSLAGGLLTGKYRTQTDVVAYGHGRNLGARLTRSSLRVIQALDDIAGAHQVSPAAIAIAWLLLRPLVVSPVVSATNPAQVSEFMRAPSIVLTRGQVERLDRVSDWA